MSNATPPPPTPAAPATKYEVRCSACYATVGYERSHPELIAALRILCDACKHTAPEHRCRLSNDRKWCDRHASSLPCTLLGPLEGVVTNEHLTTGPRSEKKVRKQRGATKAQLAYRAKLFAPVAPASPSIHDDIARLRASVG